MAPARPPGYAGVVNYLNTALAAADAAGAIIRPFFRRPLVADLKADRSPVTEADRRAEHAMRALIARNHPDHGILGEEAGGEEAGGEEAGGEEAGGEEAGGEEAGGEEAGGEEAGGEVGGGEEAGGEEARGAAAGPGRSRGAYCWVLDPIDGTRAFITGRPSFGTLIALLRDGVPVLGIIDQPITGERWIGVAGERTRFRGPFGGTPGTRACARLADAELSATSPDMLGDALPRWQRLSRATRRTSWGGDCYAYGLLALGQIDIVAERDLKIWDWAALVPVVEGAGGCVVDWQGKALNAASLGEVIAVGDRGVLGAALACLAA